MRIELPGGNYCLIDDEDYEKIKPYKWHLSRRGKPNIYAETCHNGTSIGMHRIIMNFPTEVDHINGNGLDNRKQNLRICTNQQNKFNKRKKVSCSSEFKGVYFQKERKKWMARIKINKKTRYLGRYDCEKKAAKAYNIAAKELFGEFAKLNVLSKT